MRNDLTPGARIALGFAAGALGFLLAHQPFVYLLAQLGLGSGNPIYSFAPVAPWGVPRVVSLAFWSGLWGIAFAFVLFPKLPRGAAYWILAPLLGGLAVAAVSWFIVAPLRGQPMAAGGNVQRLAIGWLVNGFFALGATIVYTFLARSRQTARALA